MRILIYTSLYPCQANPTHGVFVAELVKSLARLAQVRVVAPQDGIRQRVCASPSPRAGTAAANTGEAVRCRYWHIPKILKAHDYRFMAWSSRQCFRQALAFGPDLIHAHYAYPDGAAAAVLAAEAGLPLVVTCHGSDINVLARSPSRRRPIAWGLQQAASVIAVSQNLAEKIANLGVPASRIRHIPNGVDLSLFPPGDKPAARRALGLTQTVPWLVAVGRLEPVKGYDRLLRALARLENVHLLVVGDGSQRPHLMRLSRELGLSDRVRFIGMVPHDGLAAYYQAADALVIASHSEGWPTVIHEALACGTPVVAPAIGGISEALADPKLGLLLDDAEPASLADGISRALATSWDHTTMRQVAMNHTWDSVAAQHLGLYGDVLRQAASVPQEKSKTMAAKTPASSIVYHHRTQGVDAQGIHIHELCRGFERLGYKVTKKALHAGERIGKDSREGLLYRCIDRLPPLVYELLELGYNFIGIPRLFRTVRRERPIFIYERYSLFNCTGIAVSWLTGTPLALEVNAPLAREKALHGGLVFTKLAQALETGIINRASRTIAVSGVLKDMLVEKGADPAKIVVIPNGVNLEEYPSSQDRRNAVTPVRLGFAGWFRPWHGLLEMLVALDDYGLFQAGIELVLIGDGPSRPELERLIAARRLQGQVTITGAVDRPTLFNHLASLDIALQPAATTYASPMKLIEYLAAGKAVVAPDQDNIRELVRPDVEAVLFSPGNWDDFAARVSALVADPKKRARLGAAGRRSIIENQRTWTENAARVVALFGSKTDHSRRNL